MKFVKEANIFAWYNQEIFKSGLRYTDVLYESFRSQKWRDQEISFNKTRNLLKTMFVKTRVDCIFCDFPVKPIIDLCISFQFVQMTLYFEERVLTYLWSPKKWLSFRDSVLGTLRISLKAVSR